MDVNCCQNIGNNIILFSALVAITLGNELTIAEQDLLGNYFILIGQNLCSMASASSDCKNILENSKKNTSTDQTNTIINSKH